ncbi:MAG: SelT/SelW/SelH family protein [Gammaproteobacteria bacterium]|nr:SelT/SelW/SelH family protein [Gammaproteobacteria bacterium]
MSKTVTIYYCTRCNWMLRAAWMAQELLHTFEQELEQIALKPVDGGVFEIYAAKQLIWERKQDGGFPSPKELKQRVRDQLFPGRDLGHIDR